MRFDLLQSLNPSPRKHDECHVIVCGNEKGGSGKSTVAMHVAISLLNRGFSVATMDLDTRQQSLTRFNMYRQRWLSEGNQSLSVPDHYSMHHETALLYEISTEETAKAFSTMLFTLRAKYDFIVIDTPGSLTMLSTAAHRQADTLLTPINDSFLDFDVLANVDPQTFEIESIAQYAGAVRNARRVRQQGGRGILDWVVVRNRMSPISSRNERKVDNCLRELSMRLGFRVADGITERVVYRENFALGLTAVDSIERGAAQRKLSMSNLAARNEVRLLVDALRLPIDNRGLARAKARKMWLGSRRRPIQLPDIFVE